MKAEFLDKLIERLDRLDPESLQTHFLRLAKERGLLETVFQSIQEGILVIDGDGCLQFANRAAEELMGFSLERAEGQRIHRYLREVDWDRILNLDGKEWSKLVGSEIEVTYPEQRFLNFYVVPLATDDAEEHGVLVILRDVTHDRQHEANMLESERINAVKLLAAGVAHEIGNPLNALTIHLQLLERAMKRGDSHDDLLRFVKVARDEVGRLDSIITQFLKAIRPAKPTMELVRVDALLTDTLNLLKHEIQNRRIDVRVECPKPLPKIRLDRDQIKQAFFNIIRNAYQAMPDGGELAIGLFATDRFVGVAFRDTGKGIDQRDFARIFEPYHTTKEKGSGLGLMIVQRIVQDHGGHIEVESETGKGTTFTILLPLADRRVRLLKERASDRSSGRRNRTGEGDRP